MGYRLLISFLFLSLSGCAQQSTSQQELDQPLAFPGAEGFGKYTTGGRGGSVYVVSNLNDDGPGSLREAIRKKGPRIIVFSVSGYIDLKEPLFINNPDVTIAGQTAPGDGITLRYYPLKISTDNVIIRYLRFRLGDVSGIQDDAINGTRQKNIIIDHCSMSWATDECASFYGNENFTLQWCIISESLNSSVHAKGDHGYGGIWGGKKATFHHNLIANHNSRLPRFSGSRTVPNSPEELVDFRNNVIYNWMNNNIYGGEKGRYNIVNNYFKPGPATVKSKRDRILNPSEPYGKFFVAGNVLEGFDEISSTNKLGVVADHIDSTLTDAAFPFEEIIDHSARAAFEQVLSKVGASLWRDKVDVRVIEEIRNGTSSSGKNRNGIIDSQNEVGGWPELVSMPSLKDTDGDGMPDEWEGMNKLNPTSAEDASQHTLSKTYTNIEVYINSLVDSKMNTKTKAK